MKWKVKKIPDVLHFQEGPGVRNNQFTNEGVKLLNVRNINNGVLDLAATSVHIAEDEAYGRYKHFLADDGDLVIASSGIVVDNFHNKIAFVGKEHLPLCMNTSTIRFKSRGEINLNYFRYYLQTNSFKGQIRKLITGSAQLNFGPSHLKKIDVTVPPLPVQERIAAILDEADALRKKDAALLKKYDELLQSIFYDMFGDPVKNEKGWEVKKLGEVCEKIQTGPFGSLLHVEDYDTDGIPLVNPMHIIEGKITPDNNYAVNKVKAKELSTYYLKKGDIVMGRRGEMGRCGLVEDEHVGLICGTGSLIIRPVDLAYSTYLYYVLSSGKMKIELENVAQGVTMKNLNQSIIKNLNIAVPPFRFCQQLFKVHETIVRQKAIIKESSSRAEALFQSLMQRAFKGELV